MGVPSLALARPRTPAAWVSLLALPAVLVFTAIVYSPSLDDWFVFHDFIHIKGITSTGVGDYAQRVLDPGDGGESLFDTGKLYRPVYYLALLAEYEAFGLEPFGYHLVNIGLHLLNVALVWLIAGKLVQSRFVPAVAALIYGIHPAYIDAPSWISAITEVLLATFSLACIYLFIRSLSERGALSALLYVGSLISAVLALGAREPGVALVLILPAYYFLAFRPADWRQPSSWLRFAPFLLVVGGWALMRLSVTGAVASGEGESGVGKIGWHVFINMFKFNGWAVVPVFSRVGPWVPVLTGIAAIAFLRVSEHLLRQGTGAARFVVAWWYLAMLPYCTQATWLLAGRYMYFGMAAFAILCAMFVGWLAEGSWTPALSRVLRLPRLPWPTVARAGAAAAVLASAVVLTTVMLHREDTFSGHSEETEAFVRQLQLTYPDFPDGSSLHVVDPPDSLVFLDVPVFLDPAVRIYYPSVQQVLILRGDQLPEATSSFGERDFVFTYEP